jgi:peptidoglycan hydrolase-like protein with peptidoglycan-binding domain
MAFVMPLRVLALASVTAALGLALLGPASPASAAAPAAVATATATPLPTLRYGSTGAYVRWMQPLVGVPANGVYDSVTVAAVKRFQVHYKLPVTGVVTTPTWDWLRKVAVALKARAAAVASRGGTTGTDPTMTTAARTSRAARTAVLFAVWQTSAHGRMIVRRESGGSCTVKSPGGAYRGKWQMGAPFWKSYGGLVYAPTPDLATCLEQDKVAYKGWLAAWWTPWGG